MQINKKLLFLQTLLLVSAVALIFPYSAQAIIIVDLVTNVATVLRNVAIILIVIAFIIAGLLFLIAQGDPTKIGTAKKMVYAAIAGTIMVIIATVAIDIISNAIFQGQ